MLSDYKMELNHKVLNAKENGRATIQGKRKEKWSKKKMEQLLVRT